MNNRFVYFDFCETLVSFQTADAFVDFVRVRSASWRMNFLENCYLLLRKFQLFRIAYKLFPTGSIEKRFKLFQLKGININVLDKLAGEYYEQVIKKKFVHILLDKLKEHIRLGDRVELVSGGYSIYLKYFCSEFGIQKLHSSIIDFDKAGNCTGRISGLDCLYKNKVVILKNCKDLDSVENKSIAYTDSITDLPLLNWVNVGVVVSKGKSQDWARKLGFEQIIW